MTEIFPVWSAQTPITYTISEQLTVVIAIVVCFILAGTAARWVWSEWQKQADKDRAWREAQNAKREAHEEKQAASWQAVIDSIDLRREKGEEARHAAILRLAESVNGVAIDLRAHDAQAKTILAGQNEIKAKVDDIHASRLTNGKRTL